MGFLFDAPPVPTIDEPATKPDAATDPARQRELERRRLMARQSMATRDMLINPSLRSGDSGLSNPR